MMNGNIIQPFHKFTSISEHLYLATTEMIFALTADLKISEVNPAVLKTLGYESPEFLTAKSFYEILRELAEENLFDEDILATTSVSQMIKMGIICDQEFNLLTSSGKSIPVVLNTVRLPEPTESGAVIIVSAKDFRAWKKLEEDIRKERDFSNEIIKQIPSIICGFSPDGTICFSNPAAERLFGFSSRELHSKTLYSFISSASSPRIADFFQNATETEIRDIETAVNGSTGETRFVLWSFLRRQKESERSFEIFGFGNDLTERRRAEERVAETQRQLIHSAKLASVGTLAAGVAHEINNPLAITQLNLELTQSKLEKNGYLDPDIKHCLEKQFQSLKRIVTIVNGLRIYARPDKDTLESVDIHKVINETLSLCESIFTKNCVKIEIDLQAKDPIVNANAGKFQQVIMNLLTNARDAIGQKNTENENGIIRIQTEQKPEGFALVISDNGVGIQAHILEKIFDPFFTTKDPGKGTGLGLSICQSIIHSFEGSLKCDSQLNIGTSFTIILPAQTQRKIDIHSKEMAKSNTEH